MTAPAELIPIRWPVEWKDAARLELLKGTPVNCLAGEAPPPFPLGDLRFVKLDPEHPPEGIALREGVWPRVAPATAKDAAAAGPTGAPWVDSNAWVVRLAQLLEPGKSVWLTHQPPGGNEVTPLDGFVKAVAEAEAFGGRWVIGLDRVFREALERPGDAALGVWRRMMAAARFFERHREWRSWRPAAALAVVSSFEGEGKLMSEEFLNLAPRRHLAYRAIRLADAAQASLAGLKAVLYLEPEPPPGEIRNKLLEFARAGGLLIAPRGTVDAPVVERESEHGVCRLGSGRVAMPLDKWDDPFLLVAQVHLLLGRREDVVRVWNAESTDTFPLLAPAGAGALVHLIPYASGKTPPITLGFRQPCRSARVLGPDSERVVRATPRPLGAEIEVGEISGYTAVLLELWRNS